MIKEIAVRNLRALEDSGVIRLDSISPIVGKNDVGKSAIIYALKWFFEPPKKGGLNLVEIHGQDENTEVAIEVAFEPTKLSTTELKLDARNPTTLEQENLLDKDGLLRLRLILSNRSCGPLEAYIYDIDDAELFGLALLKQQELLQLLQKGGFPAIVSGSETNVERRNILREHALSAGAKKKEEWIDISTYESVFRSILPHFIFFPDEARYGVGETSVQNQFKGIVDRVMRTHPMASQIDQDVRSAVQGEFQKVFDHMSRMTDTVDGIKAITTVDWKKAVANIALNWIDPFGVEVPYHMRGSGVRRLFMVAYFQYESAEGLLEEGSSRYVFAIEEPEVHLHPGAQRILIEAFSELAKAGHQVIFTTHSPVFAATSDVNSLTLVERKGKAAKVIQTPTLKIEQVATELGVEVSDRLVGKNHVILVEGFSDVEFYEEALNQLHTAGYTHLNPKYVAFAQCGGIGGLKYVVLTKRMDEVGLLWAVILDSDRKNQGDPPCKEAQSVVDSHPPTCLVVHILERTCLENYLDSNAIKNITGINVDVPICGQLVDRTSGQPVRDSQKRKIRDNMKRIVTNMRADGLIKCSLPPDKTSPEECELIKIFNDMQKAFGP